MSTPLAAPAPPLAGWALFRQVARHSFSFESRPPGPVWMHLLVTALFSTAIAVALTLLFAGLSTRVRWWPMFWGTWVISQCIGFSIHLIGGSFASWGHARGLKSWPVFTRRLAWLTVTLCAVLIGYAIGFGLTGRNFIALVAAQPRFLLGQLAVAGLAVFTWYLISRAQAAQFRGEAEQARAQAQAEALRREAADAELRALQAQIEPHFLFNTLANAIALIDYEPQNAKRLLERFNDHLRATLAASRRTQSTLGDELQLLEGYLALMQLRMGSRLAYTFDVPEPLRALPFAPLLLQPLVENAITHGLEPKVEGGRVTVSAQREGARVRIVVEDTGLGTAAPASQGHGVGVSNVRHRAQALWGAGARLTVNRSANGCAAVLEFQVP